MVAVSEAHQGHVDEAPENVASDLDELSHAETLAVYRDASENIRFAKYQQWRTVLYFSVGAAAATGYEVWTRWDNPKLAFYLMILVWLFSFLTVLQLLALQWWQAVEHRKIDFLAQQWSSFTNAARARKSPIVSDLQRYGMLAIMVLYLELMTIAVTQVFWPITRHFL